MVGYEPKPYEDIVRAGIEKSTKQTEHYYIDEVARIDRDMQLVKKTYKESMERLRNSLDDLKKEYEETIANFKTD